MIHKKITTLLFTYCNILFTYIKLTICFTYAKKFTDSNLFNPHKK